MKTFEKEINWVTWEFDADKNETVETPHTKTATFNELNRTDKRQHELHFMLIDIFEGTAKANGEVDIDSFGLNPKGLLKITVKAIEDLLTENESFTKADKEKPGVVVRNVQAFLTELRNGDWEFLPRHFVTSAEKKTGREEVIEFIDQCNKALKP